MEKINNPASECLENAGPNILYPASGWIQISGNIAQNTSTPSNWVIRDGLGKVVDSGTIMITDGVFQQRVNTDGWPSGLYFFAITVNGIISYQKLVIR